MNKQIIIKFEAINTDTKEFICREISIENLDTFIKEEFKQEVEYTIKNYQKNNSDLRHDDIETSFFSDFKTNWNKYSHNIVVITRFDFLFKMSDALNSHKNSQIKENNTINDNRDVKSKKGSSRRANGEGTLYPRINKIKRKGSNLPTCPTCISCEDQSVCNNRQNCKGLCSICTDCTDSENCDKYYIYQDWVAQAYIPKKLRKNIKRATVSNKDKRELVKEKTNLQDNINKNKYIDKSKAKLVDIIKQNKEVRLKNKTIGTCFYRRIGSTIKSIENTILKDIYVQDVTKDIIKNVLLDFTETLSNSSIKQIKSEINQALDIAVDEGIILYNPIINLKKPKSNKEDKIVTGFTVEEQSKLLSYLENVSIEKEKYKNIFIAMVYTGLRVGEILALATTDINLKECFINANKTLTLDINGKLCIKYTTKTEAGTREVFFLEYLKPFLIEQLKYAIKHKSKYLFLRENGDFIHPTAVNNVFKRICCELGIRKIQKQVKLKDKYYTRNTSEAFPYCLRHTAADRMWEAGLDEKAIENLMGHVDIRFTKKHYITVHDDFRKEQLNHLKNYYDDKIASKIASKS